MARDVAIAPDYLVELASFRLGEAGHGEGERGAACEGFGPWANPGGTPQRLERVIVLPPSSAGGPFRSAVP